MDSILSCMYFWSPFDCTSRINTKTERDLKISADKQMLLTLERMDVSNATSRIS